MASDKKCFNSPLFSMQSLRCHYRKLILFIVAAAAVLMLVMSKVQPSSYSDTNNKLLVKPSWTPHRNEVIKHNKVFEAKFDIPVLSHHSTSDRSKTLALSRLLLNISQVSQIYS